ncbi:hypothetical protein TWF706_010177 [Orbilia oligospora]|uniref:Uncharacterized protein n=1 Tax=Orbilia oligospora TaxID=2813651 RepID=A0A7C8JXS0_ORBOL|nr:hypothetical protein TWF706_010177 [Orbilia oligospora]KAF3138856.1 hypothetical protein TWF703_004397 [Orbilia oligospora]
MNREILVPKGTVAYIQDGNFVHYICQDNGSPELRGITLSSEGRTTANATLGFALPGTPGSYILFEEMRAFYCVSQNNILQEFLLDEDLTWYEGGLQDQGIKLAPNSGVTATRTSSGSIFVFFQNEGGNLQYVYGDEPDEWQIGDELEEAKLGSGASMYAVTLKPLPHLFYAHPDGYIHDLAMVSDGEWDDSRIELTDVGSVQSKIFVVPTKLGYGLEFENSKREVYAVHNKERALIGKYVGGVYKHEDVETFIWQLRAAVDDSDDE